MKITGEISRIEKGERKDLDIKRLQAVKSEEKKKKISYIGYDAKQWFGVSAEKKAAFVRNHLTKFDCEIRDKNYLITKNPAAVIQLLPNSFRVQIGRVQAEYTQLINVINLLYSKL